MARQMSFTMRGVKKFMDNLNEEVDQMRGRTNRGLIEGAIEIQREAEPGTPVDTGNLRSSWFIVSYKTGPEVSAPQFSGEDAGRMSAYHQQVLSQAQIQARQLGSFVRPIVIFGYSAKYAAPVHEMVGANFKRPGAHARWLLGAMLRSQDRVLEKIRQHAEF